jgi:hypothetical protein
MKNIFVSILLTLALLTLSTGTVFAQEVSVSGIVESVEFGTDANGETIVILTLVDNPEPVQVSVETGEATATETAVGSEVTIAPEDVIPSEGEEESEHPVGSALSEFFSEMLGVDYDTIMEQHEDGFGFGVIAQALWLTNQIEGDTDTFVALLEAKESGDYSNITLADGSTPDNWGDVVRSLKKGENLGSVMSDKGANSDTEDGEGKGKGNGKDKGDKGNGNGNGNGGQGNGNGNGNNGQGNGNPNNDD